MWQTSRVSACSSFKRSAIDHIEGVETCLDRNSIISCLCVIIRILDTAVDIVLDAVYLYVTIVNPDIIGKLNPSLLSCFSWLDVVVIEIVIHLYVTVGCLWGNSQILALVFFWAGLLTIGGFLSSLSSPSSNAWIMNGHIKPWGNDKTYQLWSFRKKLNLVGCTIVSIYIIDIAGHTSFQPAQPAFLSCWRFIWCLIFMAWIASSSDSSSASLLFESACLIMTVFGAAGAILSATSFVMASLTCGLASLLSESACLTILGAASSSSSLKHWRWPSCRQLASRWLPWPALQLHSFLYSSWEFWFW